MTKLARKRVTKGTNTILVALLLVAACPLYWLVLNTAHTSVPWLNAPLRQPQRIANERIHLAEGEYIVYSFDGGAEVQLQLSATPKQVDVMLMTRPQADVFRKNADSLFGGTYEYFPALSGKKILRMDKTATVPGGAWSIIVMRPEESVLFKDGTNVEVNITRF